MEPAPAPESRHPGGLALTARLLDHARLSPGAAVGDIGCGEGASTLFLREKGCACTGVEPAVNGCAEALPFADESMDALLYECVLCLTRRQQALAEAFRVLKPGGKLLVSDVYELHSEPDFGPFRLLTFEDHRRELLSWLAQAILDDRECDFIPEKGKKYSYYLAVLEK